MRYAILLLTLMISGCTTGKPYPVTSEYYEIPKGTKVHLLQKLTIPADVATTYLQHGKEIPKKLLRDKAPHCQLEVRTITATPQTIQPDVFTVIRTRKMEEEVALSYMVASASLLHGMNEADGGPVWLAYRTELYLESGNQPDVLRLICGHLEIPNDAKHLTVAQMREALGDIIRLDLAE